MALWIESHQTLRDHPKTRKLARQLEVRLPEAIGMLHLLWWWCLDYALDGDLSRYGADEIADACDWPASPATLIAALTECQFLDDSGGLVVHDWEAYAGRLLARREYNRKRMKATRQTVACTTRAQHVQNTCTTRDKMCSATVPNKTEELKEPSLKEGAFSGEFEHWWVQYQRIGSRADALECYVYWRQHDASTDDLLLAAKHYQDHCQLTDTAIKHGSTFLAYRTRLLKPICRWREWLTEAHGSSKTVPDKRAVCLKCEVDLTVDEDGEVCPICGRRPTP